MHTYTHAATPRRPRARAAFLDSAAPSSSSSSSPAAADPLAAPAPAPAVSPAALVVTELPDPAALRLAPPHRALPALLAALDAAEAARRAPAHQHPQSGPGAGAGPPGAGQHLIRMQDKVGLFVTVCSLLVSAQVFLARTLL